MKELMGAITTETIRSNPDFRKITPDYKAIDDIAHELGNNVFGQEEACNQLARAVTRSMGGFSDPNRPEGIFMFMGSTGVGKTEMSKSLAKYLGGNDWEKRYLRIDCTEFQEPHSIARLKGSDPGYIGYGDSNIVITPEFLEQSGPKIIVLDEVEKAHGNLDRFFMPIFNEGKAKVMVPAQESGTSRWSSELAELDFADTYFILTTNVGAGELQKLKTGKTLGFGREKSTVDMSKTMLAEVKKFWQVMPEFLGRIDAFISFNELGPKEYEQIFNKFLQEINENQRYGQNYVAVTRELRSHIIAGANTGEYGARDIQHALNRNLIDKAAELKYSGVLEEGQFLIGDLAKASDVDEEMGIHEGDVFFWTNDVILDDERKNREGRYVVAKPEAPITPTIKKVEGKKNKEERDPGSFIGNRPDDHIPSEKDTGEEDIRNSIEEKHIKFYLPPDGVIYDSITLGIRVNTNGKTYQQVIENLPIIEEE